MNAKLLILSGSTIPREVRLQLPAVLGRSRKADVTVGHPLVSRRHCEISEDNGLLMLRDLASLNGTMIGGRRIELAPLLPEAEFTIGPLTFCVRYEYDGDLESVPSPRFVDEAPAEAGFGNADSAGVEEGPLFELDEALPAEAAGENELDESEMPGFVPIADEEPEDALLGEPDPLVEMPLAMPPGREWPPVANDRLPTMPVTDPLDALDEPLEVDSSLQSGGHLQESPRTTKPRAAEKPGQEKPRQEKPRQVPPASAGKGPAARPETPSEARSPAKKKPAAAIPRKKPTDSDEMDPEFGSFFEGMQ